jgi:hypothetical protein
MQLFGRVVLPGSCAKKCQSSPANHGGACARISVPSRQYNLKLTLDFYSLSAGELIEKLFCLML